MRNPKSSSAGFALAFSLVFFAIATLLMAGLFGMLSSSVRMSAIYMGNNRCRLAAQSAIEWVKPQIDIMFKKHTGANGGGAAVRIGPKASAAYAWFGNSDGNGKKIGTGTYAFVMPATNVWFNGCEVRLYFGPSGQIDNSSSAIVSIIARAKCRNANGTVSDIALEERFRFGVGRSKVFDYAYFVNNYGWFQGTGCTANGDVRANGDMYLDSGCKVNGEVYAAQNDELNVRGNINATGKMDSRSAYWSSAKTTGQSRPTSPTSNPVTERTSDGQVVLKNGEKWVGGYDAPENTPTNADLQRRTHANEETGIAMPWIGDLSQYVEYAQEENGRLSGGYKYTQDAATGNLVKQANGTINAHYSGAGPSGNAALSDKGSIVLEGTRENPIRLNGPVVIDSDVVIKGYVTGQGTIYSGRNIHVVGDIKYVNPPNWPHPDTNPKQTAKNNSTKDLVGFAAKGNIVFGYDANGFSGISNYLEKQPYVQQYACDASDKDIGYPRTVEYGYSSNESKFCGSYRQVDGGKLVQRQEVTHKETKTTYDRYGRKQTSTVTVSDGYKFVDSKTRHYYDSVVEPSILKNLYGTTKITNIDGVLYNNHGIFGYLGACTINGALICRNEGIQYSSYLNINHDIRLREDSMEGLSNDALGMPVGASPPGVVSWHEVPVGALATAFGDWDTGWSANAN